MQQHKLKEKILYSKSIKQWHIQQLLNGDIDVVRIPQYLNRNLLETIQKQLFKTSLVGNYVNAPLITRIGQAFFECQNNDIMWNNYKNNSTRWIKEMRDAIYPIESPIDKLRLELDEEWNAGCSLANIGTVKLFTGLVREFKKGTFAEPHCDVIKWDLLNGQHTSIYNQLAFNIYMKIPKQGGNLLLWDMWPNKDQYSSMKKVDSYGIDYEYIREDPIEISPQLGELILFNSMRIHAVQKVRSDSRITWSSFIGFSGENEPLQIWS